MGLEESLFKQVNLEQLISDAIKVREGRLQKVPQTVMIVEGIWPPELVPLFLKEGRFPEYADEDIEQEIKPFSIAQLSNGAIAGLFSDGRNNSIRKFTRKLSVIRKPHSEKKSLKYSSRLPQILEFPEEHNNNARRPFSISNVKYIDSQNSADPSPEYF